MILVCRIGELEQYIADLVQNNLALEERLDKHRSRLYKLENLNIPHQVSKVVDEIVADAVDWATQAPLRARFRDLSTVDMKEILQQRMLEDNSYKAHEFHNDLYEALHKSLELDYSNQRLAEQEEARKKRRKRRDVPRTPPGSPPSQPPPPPPPAGASGAPGTSGVSGSSQFPPPPPPPPLSTGTAQQQGSKALSLSKTAASASQSMAWTTSDTRFESTDFSAAQALSPTGTDIKKRTKIKTNRTKPSMRIERAGENNFNGALGFYWGGPAHYCIKAQQGNLKPRVKMINLLCLKEVRHITCD
ncbi:retrovirus-related pol polyprotein from transposon TNT 1-94 [Tanacetum coccineum]